jgi:hypothetical protein
MSSVAGDLGSHVLAQAAQRWAAIDPLLPGPALPAGCGTDLVAAGTGGHAVGSCEHWVGEPGSMDLTWGAARRFRLTPQVAGPDVAGGLDQLLAVWREHLAGAPGSAEEDTAAVISWPTRDIDGVKPLLRHGLAPLAVIAARVAGRGPAGPAAPAGLRIRRAGPADLDTVTELGMATVRYDAHFGTVIERPHSAAALRRDTAGLLAAADPWIWLAEQDGTPVGLLYAEPPEAAAWIAPMTGRAPGTGAALVDEFHRIADAAGVAVTLLHYEQVNPLSGPFWSHRGYRPLWTSWEARPARVLR